jgi:uncharacterized protein YciI
MFIIDLTYKVSLEQIDACMKAHVEFLDKYFASGNFIIAGRKHPRNGGIIIALASNKEEIENIANEDPFYINNLADIRIIEFSGGRKAEHINELLANTSK